jgi:hypothetical protein
VDDVEDNFDGMWIRMELGGENGATLFILNSNSLNGDLTQFQTIINLLQLRLMSSPVAEKGLTEA